MATKLFTLYGQPSLGRKIQDSIQEQMNKNPEQNLELKVVLSHRSKNLGRLSFLKLRLLNQEFNGKVVPAIRFFVASSRCASKTVDKIKQKFRGKK
jgi:hypothetical protein